ncbi:Na+/H+ antiporter NhaC family protein [Clostridium sp.]|uniref:Na+/H+ antiporter NhaC family protein n=1 Tax=Clostridium sp. TaxID=1506 RepID=UPI003464CF7D
MEQSKGSFKGLLPLIIFLIIYMGGSLYYGDFYGIPILIPFIIAAIVSLFIGKNQSIDEKLSVFCKGVGNENIIMMILIFILSGAFAELAKDMGAIDATVSLGMRFIPSNLIVAGMFIVSCIIALAIGTSMGTIVSLVPIGVEIASKTSLSLPLIVGAVVGGAMFGDNLSMISDTTIAATKTQGCNLKDKFKINFKVVILPAIITAIIFIMISPSNISYTLESNGGEIVKVMPYLLILIGALSGLNVIVLLTLSIFVCGLISLGFGYLDLYNIIQSLYKGIMGMGEIIIISLIIGGIVEMVKYHGGIDFILNLIKSKVKTKRGAELGIGGLVSLVDICTANNTIAIITVGPIAKDISNKFNLDPKRVAGILDMFACVFQGIIPYGAQLLSASALAKISSFEIMKYLYYPYIMGIFAIAYIVIIPSYKRKTE